MRIKETKLFVRVADEVRRSRLETSLFNDVISKEEENMLAVLLSPIKATLFGKQITEPCRIRQRN